MPQPWIPTTVGKVLVTFCKITLRIPVQSSTNKPVTGNLQVERYWCTDPEAGEIGYGVVSTVVQISLITN